MLGFNVYRSANSTSNVSDAADATCGAQLQPAPQACEISGLASGEYYKFQVAPMNVMGEGPRSPISVLMAGRPPGETNATLFTQTSSSGSPPSLTFSFSAAEGYGQIVYNYRIQIILYDGGLHSGHPDTVDLGGSDSSPCDNTSITLSQQKFTNITLQAGSQYRFRIQAENKIGNGTYSDYSSTEDGRGILLSPLPGPVSGLAIDVNNSIRIPDNSSGADCNMTLTWLPYNASAEQGYETIPSGIGYYLYGSSLNPNPQSEASNTALLTTVTGDECSVTDRSGCTYLHNGLTSGQTWHYAMRARNRAYNSYSPYSSVLSQQVAVNEG